MVGVAHDRDVVATGVAAADPIGIGRGAGDVGHNHLAIINGADDVRLELGGLRLIGAATGDLHTPVGVAAELLVQDVGDLVDAVGAIVGGAEQAARRVACASVRANHERR